MTTDSLSTKVAHLYANRKDEKPAFSNITKGEPRVFLWPFTGQGFGKPACIIGKYNKTDVLVWSTDTPRNKKLINFMPLNEINSKDEDSFIFNLLLSLYFCDGVINISIGKGYTAKAAPGLTADLLEKLGMTPDHHKQLLAENEKKKIKQAKQLKEIERKQRISRSQMDLPPPSMA